MRKPPRATQQNFVSVKGDPAPIDVANKSAQGGSVNTMSDTYRLQIAGDVAATQGGS